MARIAAGRIGHLDGGGLGVYHLSPGEWFLWRSGRRLGRRLAPRDGGRMVEAVRQAARQWGAAMGLETVYLVGPRGPEDLLDVVACGAGAAVKPPRLMEAFRGPGGLLVSQCGRKARFHVSGQGVAASLN